MLHSEDQLIDLPKFTKDFELDVELNPNGTYLQQEQDGIITAVSRSFIQMCKPNKHSKVQRPIGFVKIQYSEMKKKRTDQILAESYGRKTITRPPVGPIPVGAWCSDCKNAGPSFHKEDCDNPVDESLRVTLYGFITCVLEGGFKTDPQLDSDIIELISVFTKDSFTPNTKDEYLELVEEGHIDEYLSHSSQELTEDWPFLNIAYKRIIKNNKKSKSFFSNCSIIGYNFPDSGSVSIRVYKSGLVHLISCPWEHKTFYTKFIKKLNDTDGIGSDSYIIDTNESLVKNVFSSFALFEDASEPELELDLEKLYNYLWPLDEDNNPILNGISPKRVFTKKYTYSGKEIDHNYLINQFSETNDTAPFYRFDIEYRSDLSTPKIIMRVVPCTSENDIPKFCKPYKITIMIFTSGKVQLIFSRCKEEYVEIEEDKLCDENPYIIPDNINDQYSNIQQELEYVMDFIYNTVDKLSNSVIIKSDKKLSSKRETTNTVPGIFPYKKRTKLKIGEKVEVFDDTSMTWEGSGIVSNIKNDNILVKTEDDETELTINDLRPVKQSSMQIARSKIGNTDIENKPNPFGFRGKCNGGDKYFIPFGGRQARDNLYYPYCSVKNKDKYELYIDQILDGFPLNDEDEEEFNIERNAKFDLYSGMLRRNIVDVGKVVKFTNDGEELDGIIISKYRTHDRGLDNVVIYVVQTDTEDEYEIEGKDLLPEYREDRRWKGVSGNDTIKKAKLLACAEKLGLSRSSYTTELQNTKLQNKIAKELDEFLGDMDRNTSVLTSSIFSRFEDRSYMAMGFPSGSHRVLFYSNGISHYFIDDSNVIMTLTLLPGAPRQRRTLPLNDDEYKNTIVLDGYIKTQNDITTYYPIDCLIYGGSPLNKDYISTNEDEDEDESVIDDYINTLDLDPSDYTDLIDNLKYGRIIYVILLSKLLDKSQESIRFSNPINYITPFLGTFNKLGRFSMNIHKLNDRSIIEDTSTILRKSNESLDLIFIPQSGSSNYLQWKRSLKTPIVLELIKKTKKGCTVGVGKKYINQIGETLINISTDMKKHDFLKFDLNFMFNGKLNPEDPITLSVIDPIVTKKDMLTYKRTQLIVDAMVNPIPEKVFLSPTKWKLNSTTLVVSEDDPGINPLIAI
jgi:hypothetical protein